MIHYDNFQYATPPQTASEFVVRCFDLCGLSRGQALSDVKYPPSDSWDGYVLSTVRHPYYWLHSFWHQSDIVHGIADLDELTRIARIHFSANSFIVDVAERFKGFVGSIYESYKSDTILRVEDFPYNLLSFMHMMELPGASSIQLSALNDYKRSYVPVDERVKKLIVVAEYDFCERYDYS